MHGTSVIYTATSRRTDHRAGEGEEVNDEQYDANPPTAVSLSDSSKQGSGLLSVFCSTTLLSRRLYTVTFRGELGLESRVQTTITVCLVTFTVTFRGELGLESRVQTTIYSLSRRVTCFICRRNLVTCIIRFAN